MNKRLEISKTILHTAQALGDNLKVAYPKKKLFRKDKYLRAPIKRRNKQRARAMVPLIAAIGAAQVHIIMSQPVPKHNFPPGGRAYIAERGPELIEVNGKIEINKVCQDFLHLK